MLSSSLTLQGLQHEIRTPLTTIFGMISCLKDSCLTTAQINYVNAIFTSANHLLNVANKLDALIITSKVLKPKKPKVLLVEDDLMIQYIHKNMLSNVGCEVEVAKNAAEALSLVNNAYDFFVLDIGLPDLSGIEVAKKIRFCTNHSTTPILALTAYIDLMTEKACLEAGFACVLHKPITLNKLAKVLRDYNLIEEDQHALT